MEPILLKNASLLDCDTFYETADVLICDSLIRAVEKSISPNAAPVVIDLAGYTLLPGIFNNHIHYVDPQGDPTKTFSRKFLEDWVQRGVTGVRDMGIDPDFKTYEDYSAWKGAVSSPFTPDLYSYGYFQHLSQLKMPKDMPPPPAAHDGSAPPPPRPFRLIGSVENARKAALAAMQAGCEGIKIHGFERDEALMSQIRAMVEIANEYGAFVSAHINTSDETMVLLECGAHEAAHIATDLTPQKDIDRMARAGFMVCPTISAYTRMFRDGMLTPRMYENVQQNIENYHKAGVRLTVGTDFMGIIDPPYEDTGIPVFEMKMMAQCGMSVQDIVAAASAHPAYLCKAQGQLGKIAPGFRANLIAVSGRLDPTFEQLNNVALVINKGHLIKSI